MQIQKIDNSNVKNSTSFTSLKGVFTDGLYDKYPAMAEQVLDAFVKNPKAMKFCEKYDVKIGIHACKNDFDDVSGTFVMKYKDIVEGKFKKFIKFFFPDEKEVKLSAFHAEYDVERGMKMVTEDLKDAVSPEVPDKTFSGCLDSNIKFIEEERQKKEAAKLAEQLKEQQRLEAENSAKNRFETEKQSLERRIKDLTDNSNK